jgi:hypothetical protein
METARAHGIAIDSMIKKDGSFRETLKNGWLTSTVLTETLSKFTGDLSAAQLKAMGYNDKQIAGIIQMGKTAQDAATKVKTVSQLISTLQEAVGSGWAQTWQLVFGDFGEAKNLFTEVSNVLGNYISVSSKTRNKLLGDWKAMGGRTALIDGIANSFNALLAVTKPIGDAFRSIFPETTGKQLADLSKSFRDFTSGLKIGADTADKIQRTFSGVFAVLHIGQTILVDAAKLLVRLFSSAGEGSSNFLDTAASIGDFLVKVDEALTKGGALDLWFTNLGDKLVVPIKLLKQFGNYLGSLFGKTDFTGATNGIGSVIDKLTSLSGLGDVIKLAWSKVVNSLSGVWTNFYSFSSRVAEAAKAFVASISGAFSGLDFEKILALVNTGLFAAVVLIFKKFTKGIVGALTDRGGPASAFESIKSTLEEVTNTLKTMQQVLKATILLEIAAAIALLTVSIVALSKIDAEGLTKALTAISVMFTQLLISMSMFQKIAASGGFLKLPILAASLILVAIAVDILASAVTKLSNLKWDELLRGLTGVSVLLLALSGAVKLMSGQSKGMVTTGAGLILLSVGIRILVGAVTDLSGLSWEEMAKGLTGVAVLLTALTLFTKFSDANKGGIAQGAGLILLAVGIKILASAISDIANISWEGIAKGLTVLGVALGAIGLALGLLPPSSVLSAVSILIVAASLSLIANALDQMGKMSWESIAKGLVALGGALGIIAGAMMLMTNALPGAAALIIVAASLAIIAPVLDQFGKMPWENIAKAMVVLAGSLLIITAAMIGMTEALPGAAALIIVAGALAILAPVLVTFGNMSWESIAKGLTMLAGALAIIGIAGALLTPVIPTLIGLGVAVALLGVGMLAAGVGLLAMSVGLTTIAVAGGAAGLVIIGLVAGLIGLIPELMKQLGLGIVAFAEIIATAGPSIFKAITTVVSSMIDAILILAPKIVGALLKLIVLLLKALADAVPSMVSSGNKMLIGILNGITKDIGKIIKAGTDLVVAFIKGISDNQGKVTDAGVKAIVSFVNGLASAIRNNNAAMRNAGANLAGAIISGMTFGLSDGVGSVIAAASRVAQSALNAAMHIFDAHSPSREFRKIGQYGTGGLALGLEDMTKVVVSASTNVGSSAIKAMSKSIAGMAELVNGGMIDVAPTITPVLDLTAIEKSAGAIDGMLSSKPITVDAAYSAATTASAGYNNNQAATTALMTAPPPAEPITFIQNNNSPKALSSADIYRQTNNQLSKAKGALGP